MGQQVNFKKGSQSALDALSTYVAGSFYLTTDTNRLYFAQSASNLVHLNQYVHIWEGAGLPSVSPSELGDIYYLQQQNILAIYTEKEGRAQWIQLNPDTSLKQSSSVLSVGSTTENVADITALIQDEQGGTIKHTASGSVSIVGGTNVSVSVDDTNGTITIAATDTNDNTTYTIAAATVTNGAAITLTDNAATPNVQSVNIKGSGGITVSQSAGEVIVSGSNPVDGIDSSFDEDGLLTTTISIQNTTQISSVGVTPTIAYGNGAVKSNAVFSTTGTGASETTPVAALNVYTVSEVDDLINSKLASFDAMSFKGFVNSEASAITNFTATEDNAPQAGDTYKATGSFTFSTNDNNVPASLRGVEVRTGDLIIATGDDENIVWTVVPSGDEQLLAFDNDASANAVLLKDTLSNSTIGGFTFEEDSDSTHSVIGINATENTSTHIMSYELVHGNAGTGSAVTVTTATTATTQTATGSITIPVITGISKDVHGHITSVSASEYILTDTHATLNNITTDVSATDNVGVYTLGIYTDNNLSGMKSADLVLASDNLAVTTTSVGTSNGFKVNLEWGSFD